MAGPVVQNNPPHRRRDQQQPREKQGQPGQHAPDAALRGQNARFVLRL